MTTKNKLNDNEPSKLSEFEELLGQFDYNFKKGDIVKGKVIGYTPNSVLVDIGAKTTARVPLKELSLTDKTPEEALPLDNQEREFLIIREEDEDGQLTLSYKKVLQAHAWKDLEKLKEEDAVIEAEVTTEVKGGLLVEIFGIRGFVPSSHIRTKDVSELVGQKIPLKILSVDPKENNLILSNRKVISEQQAEQRRDIFENISEGSVVEGEIVRLADFGAFVDIGGIDGLLPLSQISWRWVDHPSDILSVGEKVKVQVIGIDEEKQRVSLSIKSLQPDPWVEAAKEIKEGTTIKGTVIRVKPFGAFVEIYPGVEALLPFKDLLEYQNKKGVTVQQGQEIETIVLKFNAEDRRISLTTPASAEQTEAEQQEEAPAKKPKKAKKQAESEEAKAEDNVETPENE
ncbi:MAG: 30S ribosomal protein S1 [Candidatus Gastranaerophilales bacterium]|nr:30S ribosomal protein S1 [Candidatus Gastranaerophilales bacterium]